MESLLAILVVIALFGGFVVWSHFVEFRSTTNQLRKTLDECRSLRSALQVCEKDKQRCHEQQASLQSQLLHTKARCEQTVSRKSAEVRRILEEASSGFPWLVRAIANYETLLDLQVADELEIRPHAAKKAAESIRGSAAKARQFREEYLIARSRLDYYEALFPWLTDFIGVDLDELISHVQSTADSKQRLDPVGGYLTAGEYATLSSSERSQLALERYLVSRKSAWEIGRDYERYIGYRFECSGSHVEYCGIDNGLSDLGRDLIVTQNGHTKVVQCKCWSQHRTVHEKHIAQLFGTATKYKIEHPEIPPDHVVGVFVTSTQLSPMATAFAQQLGVVVREGVKLDPYPIIKCNIGRDELGVPTRIYHLPMDQQYDHVKLDRDGEKYVETASEAEALGFRRAWTWRSEPNA